MTTVFSSPDDPQIMAEAQAGIMQALADLSGSLRDQDEPNPRPAFSVARSSCVALDGLFTKMGDAARIDRLLANVSGAMDGDAHGRFLARHVLPEMAVGIAGGMDYGAVSGYSSPVYPIAIVISHHGRLPPVLSPAAASEIARVLPGIGLLPPFSRVTVLPALVAADQAVKLTPGRCWEMAQNVRTACLSGEMNPFSLKRIEDRAFGKSVSHGGGKHDFGAVVLFGAWSPPPEGIEADAFKFFETCSSVPDANRDVLVNRASKALGGVIAKAINGGVITSINPTWIEGITGAAVVDVLHQSANLARRRRIHPTMNFDDGCCAPARNGYQIALKRPEGLIGPIHVSHAAWSIAGSHILRWVAQVTKKPSASTSTTEQFEAFIR